MPDQTNGRDIIVGQKDLFGAPTVNVLKNVLENASHYPISPERWRLFVDGTRQFPQYGSVSQYNHAGPNHELIPGSSETVVMQTAERPRYAVGFEQLSTQAVSLSRSLESGDQLRFGLFDDNDGWFIEHNPSHADDEVDLVVRQGGSAVSTTSDVELNQPLTDFAKYEAPRTAWYRVSRQLYRQSIGVNGVQENEEIGRTNSVNGGPEVGNLPLRFEVTRGSSSSALTVNAGSVALITQGDNPTVRRYKTHRATINSSSTADGSTWFPVYAMRVDPDRSIVDTEVTQLNIMEYAGAGDIELTLQAHAPSKVADSGGNQLVDADFNVPILHNPQNSVLQESTAVAQASDNDGTVTTSTADSVSDNPGGYQVGYSSLYSSGEGSQAVQNRSGTRRKRAIYGGDIAVLWELADNADVDYTVEFVTEQDW